MGLSSVELEYGEECLLRYLYVSNLLHSLLTLLLFLKQFALSADVSSVAFCGNVLAYALDGLACHNLRTYGSLYGNVELLSRYEVFQFLAHPSAECDGIVLMSECRQGVYCLAIEQYVELGEFRWPEGVDMVVE